MEKSKNESVVAGSSKHPFTRRRLYSFFLFAFPEIRKLHFFLLMSIMLTANETGAVALSVIIFRRSGFHIKNCASIARLRWTFSSRNRIRICHVSLGIFVDTMYS